MTNKVSVPIIRLIWKQSRVGWVGIFLGVCTRFREKKNRSKVKVRKNEKNEIQSRRIQTKRKQQLDKSHRIENSIMQTTNQCKREVIGVYIYIFGLFVGCRYIKIYPTKIRTILPSKLRLQYQMICTRVWITHEQTCGPIFLKDPT